MIGLEESIRVSVRKRKYLLNQMFDEYQRPSYSGEIQNEEKKPQQSKKSEIVIQIKETSSPKGNDRSPESNVPRSNLISKNSNSSKL